MSFENFKKIIDDIGSYLYRVDLHNWGEPMLNDEIYRIIEYAHSRNIEVRLSSNLNRMGEDRAEKLVSSGLNVLIVSLDGASQETYTKYRIGGKYDKVLDGVQMVAEARKKLRKQTPQIVWQFIVMKHNEHEIPKVKDVYGIFGFDRIDLLCVRPDMGREILWSDEARTENLRRWLPNNEEFCAYDRLTKKKKKPSKTCSFLWVQAAINWNGSVSPCCAVYDEEYDFGNAFEEGFKKIWNNEKYRTARQIVRKRGADTPSENMMICYYCTKNGFI